MNNFPKLVFSRTLGKVDWNNSKLVKDELREKVSKLRQEPGKEIAIFGSGELSVSLTQMGLIDECRIMVNPVILGHGNLLFKGNKDKLKLKLLKTRAFSSGNVLLYYRPDLTLGKSSS